MSALAGLRIVVTRAAHQAEAMAVPLRAAGAVPVLVPAITITPPDSPSPLDDALRGITSRDWVVFTSVNGVLAAFSRADALGLSTDDWRQVRIAAIGPATASALARRGLHAVAMPDEHRSERIADAMGRVKDAQVLLLRADIARPALPRLLAARGAVTDDVIAYQTRPAPHDPAAAARLAGADAVTFTSASTVHGLTVVLGEAWPHTLAGVAIASIGPVTTNALTSFNVRVDVEARTYTVPGLIDALKAFFAQHPTAARRQPPRT